MFGVSKNILFHLKNKMIGIPASSFHQIGKVLFEKANGIQFNEHLYDSAVSFMKPGSDKLNSSFYDYSSSDSSHSLKTRQMNLNQRMMNGFSRVPNQEMNSL